jgi:hypothetical protein
MLRQKLARKELAECEKTVGELVREYLALEE